MLRYQLAQQGQYILEVKLVKLLYREAGGVGEFQYHHLAAAAHYAAHLFQPGFQVLEVAHAIGAHHHIVGAGGKGHRFAVARLQGYDVLQVEGSDLFAAYFQHLVGNVNTGNGIGVECIGGIDGHIAGAGGYIQYLFGSYGTRFRNRFFAPSFIDSHRQEMIEKVVAAGYIVEHFRYLRFLA